MKLKKMIENIKQYPKHTNKKKFLALVFALIFVLSVNNKIDTLHKEKETLKKEETMTLKKRKF